MTDAEPRDMSRPGGGPSQVGGVQPAANRSGGAASSGTGSPTGNVMVGAFLMREETVLLGFRNPARRQYSAT